MHSIKILVNIKQRLFLNLFGLCTFSNPFACHWILIFFYFPSSHLPVFSWNVPLLVAGLNFRYLFFSFSDTTRGSAVKRFSITFARHPTNGMFCFYLKKYSLASSPSKMGCILLSHYLPTFHLKHIDICPIIRYGNWLIPFHILILFFLIHTSNLLGK